MRLERNVRKWRTMTAGLVLLSVVAVTIAATDDPKSRILDCAGVRVWNNGKKLVELGSKDGKAGRVTTYTKSSKRAVELAVASPDLDSGTFILGTEEGDDPGAGNTIILEDEILENFLAYVTRKG